MRIYPAIDIKLGRAVRLYKGDMEQSTDYGAPADCARRWQERGAAFLHVVDLDGAFFGKGENLAAVREICGLGLPVQLGGGIRDLAGIEQRLQLGVTRVILGTIALENPELVRQACKLFPGRVVCGIDAKQGRVAVRGWVDVSSVAAVELALRMRDAGVDTLVYTDISRDGTLQGPGVDQTRELIRRTGMRVIGSGGIGQLSDLAALKAVGCEGAIVGKALYAGRFTLEEALKIGGEKA